MKRVTFQRLTLEGFKSFREPASFKINRGAGLWFLAGENAKAPRMGSNGAGKSTLWDALCWCLFGRTVKKLGNVDVKPWGKPMGTAVSVRLAVDGVAHVIKRELGSKARLTINESEKGGEAPAELIGMSFELFTNTVLLGQGRSLFYDLSNTEKMKLFGDVLQLDRWDDRAEAAKQGAQLRIKNADKAQAAAETYASVLEGARLRLQQAKARQEDDEANRDAQAKALKAEHAAVFKEYRKAETRRDNANLAYDGSATEAKALERDYRTLQDTRFAMLAEQDVYKLKIATAEKEAARIEKAIARLDKTGNCPTCGQRIKGDTHKHRDGLAADLKAQRKIIKLGVPNAILSAIADLEDQVSTAYKARQIFDSKREQFEAEWNHAKEECGRLQTKLAVIDAKLQHVSEPSDAAFQVNKARKAVQQLKTTLAEMDDAARRARRMAKRYQFWQKGFKEIKLFELEDVLNELALNTSIILPEFGLDGWNVVYDIERVTQSGDLSRGLVVLIESPMSDRQVKWESWSGGEAQRLRLVGSLALSETLLQRAGVSVALEILDEPTQHLSTNGVNDMVEHLHDRAQRRKSVIWLADHMVMPSSQFSGMAKVTRSGKGSSLA